MKLRNPSVWIAIVSAIAVAGFVVGDISRRTSPGDLTEVHKRESDLTGRWHCSNCHGGWRQSMTEACLECHKTIGGQVAANAGLHGHLDKQLNSQCALCHSEHHGSEFVIVNDKSFANAGTPDVSKYDHETIGYRMGGKHLEIACDKCHTHARDSELPKDTPRYGGLKQDCTPCHKDPHEGRMAQGCADCHDEVRFDDVFYRDHDKWLPLIGGHDHMGCRDCHAKGDKFALEAIGHFGSPPARTCSECHESPHRKEFVSGVASLLKTSDGASCGHCHKPEHVAFLALDVDVTREEHARTGYPLDPPHDDVGCDDCHAVTETYKNRYPGRGVDDCGKCHKDPHGGQFDGDLRLTNGCVACHARETFEPHTFGVRRHSAVAFPLTGKHLDTECNDCHKDPPKGRPRQYNNTPSDCVRCHVDSHNGFFDERLAADNVHTKYGTCARCHDTTSFSNLAKKGFDHEHFTGFALTGAHSDLKCEECHKRSKKPDKAKRTFGRIASLFGKAEGCARCHADPHSGLFDRPVVAHEIAGKTDCARCHDDVSWKLKTDRRKFEHGKFTGFTLDGAHARIRCAGCHVPLDEPDKLRRTTSKAKGNTCEACHTDVHAGQFAEEGATDCTRCHRSSAAFSDVFFNHDLDSRYRLDETHAAVACERCHKPEQIDGVEVIRYRPLGMECVDCHGSQNETIRRRKGKRDE